jgi:hypothetical protein
MDSTTDKNPKSIPTKAKDKVFDQMTPTSHPDLFMGPDGRLVHRALGQLNHNALHLVALPDGRPLKVHFGAPEISVNILSRRYSYSKGPGAGEAAEIMELFKEFAGSASPYFVAGAIALKVLDLLLELADDTDEKIAALDQKLNSLMIEVGAADYLALLRAMAQMRGNALGVMQTLSALRTLIGNGDATAWYTTQLIQRDAQLQTDINALLDPSEPFFRRVYVEKFAAGDGHWLKIMSDRAVDGMGTTFEYRVALPTLLLLISTRLTMMKMVVPDFVAKGTFSAEIDHWWRRIQQMADRMGFFVRPTPVTDLPVQCARRQTDGGQKLGQFYDWQKHCHIPPPYSICPIGAVDITTGYAKIEWDYVQFDEWYLAKGNLHGRNAGYWPPSIGPQWYKPPPNATGLPDLVQSGQQYLFEARQRANEVRYEVTEEIGVSATSVFAWSMFSLAHPGVGTPI